MVLRNPSPENNDNFEEQRRLVNNILRREKHLYKKEKDKRC